MASAASPRADGGRAGPEPASERGALGRSLDASSVAVFVLAWLAAALGLAQRVSPIEAVVLACVALPAGHLVADLLSGLLHWFADEFFEEDTPLLGPTLIHGFRDHHRNPRDILSHGLLEVSGYNALASLPVLVALTLWPPGSGFARTIHAVLLATTLSVAATNQFHRYAHADRTPRVVGWLQRHGLILSPESHARHHLSGDRAYCVTAGWWNRPLDAAGLLRAISGWVHRLAWGRRRAR